MPKVSFRMASACRESVFGAQTNTARKIHRSDHTEGRLTTAPSGCCVRKGTLTGHFACIAGAFPRVRMQRASERVGCRLAVQLRAEERALEKEQRALQEKVEHADDRYSNLEIGIGALQIAIVLASLSIVAAATWLLGAGVLAGVIGLAYVAYAIAVT